MKLIIAVIQDQDSNQLSKALVENHVGATKLASTGGFLRSGNTTFIIGTEDERVDKVLQIIKENCRARTQMVNVPPLGTAESYIAFDPTTEIEVGGATVFVIPIEQFMHF